MCVLVCLCGGVVQWQSHNLMALPGCAACCVYVICLPCYTQDVSRREQEVVGRHSTVLKLNDVCWLDIGGSITGERCCSQVVGYWWGACVCGCYSLLRVVSMPHLLLCAASKLERAGIARRWCVLPGTSWSWDPAPLPPSSAHLVTLLALHFKHCRLHVLSCWCFNKCCCCFYNFCGCSIILL